MIFRCIHRHTIDEHPACFAQGLVKQAKEEKEFVKATGKAWYQYPGYKIGYLDIETTGFDGDADYLLSWCIKEKGGKVYGDVIKKEDIFSYKFDLNVLKSLLNKLLDYRIIVTYYGDRFDIPFIRTRALANQMTFPAYGQIFTWDLYWTVKNKLKLSRNSLERVYQLLNIDGKTHLDIKIWQKARIGEEKALKYVLKHNEGDVIGLEKVHEKLEPFRKWTKRSI